MYVSDRAAFIHVEFVREGFLKNFAFHLHLFQVFNAFENKWSFEDSVLLLEGVDLGCDPRRVSFYFVQAFLCLLLGVVGVVAGCMCLDPGVLHHLVSFHDHLEKSLNRGLGFVHLLAAREQLDRVFRVYDAALVAGVQVKAGQSALVLLLDGQLPLFLETQRKHECLQSAEAE